MQVHFPKESSARVTPLLWLPTTPKSGVGPSLGMLCLPQNPNSRQTWPLPGPPRHPTLPHPVECQFLVTWLYPALSQSLQGDISQEEFPTLGSVLMLYAEGALSILVLMENFTPRPV